MNHVVTWFEIPVTNMERAKHFYQQVMETSVKDDAMNGYQMAISAADDHAVSGMLMLGEHYEPSPTGAVIYLNGSSLVGVTFAGHGSIDC